MSFLPQSRAGNAQRWLNSAACTDLCTKIQSCAERMSHPETGRLLCHIAACESGKFCASKQVRSPNGLYHGPFQFGRPTWKSVCQPIFKKNNVSSCSGPKSIYDSCCTSMCASEIIAAEVNGGIRNWPRCGPQAEREVAAERN